MFPKPSTSISREGLYYLCVVLFIIGGAVLRDRNLLIVLAGMMIGPLVFNWRMVIVSLRNFRVRRRAPRRASAGEAVTVELLAENQRRRLGSWAVQVEDPLVRDHDDQPVAQAEVLFDHVPAGGAAALTYRCILPQRGRYRFGPLRANTRFPLGLVRATWSAAQSTAAPSTATPTTGTTSSTPSVTSADSETLIVCPRLGRLSPEWRRLLDGTAHGSQLTDRRRGDAEGDYYGLREWRAGDSRRWIHWRTTARLGELAVRQFERQRSRDAILVVDLWRDNESESQTAAVEWALSFAATAVVDLGSRTDSRVTVAVAGASLQSWNRIQASRVLAEEVLDHLALVEGGPGDHLDAALERARPHARADVPFLVISTRPRPRSVASGVTATSGRGTIWLDVHQTRARRLYRLT